MSLELVVARSLNNVIGNNGDIPWKVRGEQKLFKEITMNSVLIMGRKTFESIGRPLPGRETIIVTRNAQYHQPDCVIDLFVKIAGTTDVHPPENATILGWAMRVRTINQPLNQTLCQQQFYERKL